ncbi:ferredoxin [Actinophytocola sp.]|uniref:ferredoxin n=1 Tax=Actinophytocola sp. TaxID=1872138 RepID=UPI003D6A9580
MRVDVARDRCCGYGACVSVAPEVFDIGDDEIAVVLIGGELRADLHGRVTDAAHACPNDAVLIEE